MTQATTPAAPAGRSGGARRWLLIVVAIVVAGALAAAIVIVVSGGDDAASATEVRLEPIDSATDPFAPSGSVGRDVAVTAVETNGPTAVEGGRVGLYGGTMSATQCDREQLVTFLQENPDKGSAWAAVVGITPEQIPTYVGTLTPVLLRSDTLVTNHGFADGRATATQSVLQAGTAVLVDPYGQPVTKCYCGNPLQPPVFTPPGTPTTTTTYDPTTTTRPETTTTTYDGTTTTTWYETPPTYEGPTWPGWTGTSVTVITVEVTVVEVFVVVDVETGEAFNRPAGTDGSADAPVDVPPEDDEALETTTTTGGSDPSPTTSGPAAPRPSPSTTYESTTTTRPETTTTTYEPTTTTSYAELPDEPCMDPEGNIVPCG